MHKRIACALLAGPCMFALYYKEERQSIHTHNACFRTYSYSVYCDRVWFVYNLSFMSWAEKGTITIFV